MLKKCPLKFDFSPIRANSALTVVIIGSPHFNQRTYDVTLCTR